MGNFHHDSLADKRRELEELDDCSTLCFPKKKISNMEAKDESQGPQPQLQGPQRQSMGKSDDCCSILGQVAISTVWCAFFICGE